MNEIANAYLHVSNSGVIFSVIDEGHGPVIKIESSSFGNLVTTQKFLVSPDELTVLARMFDFASKHPGYSDTYCIPAQVSQTYPHELIKGFEIERSGDCSDKVSAEGGPVVMSNEEILEKFFDKHERRSSVGRKILEQGLLESQNERAKCVDCGSDPVLGRPMSNEKKKTRS